MAYSWSSFKTLVKSLITDAALNDTTAVLAVAHFVKAGIALQVDKNPTMAGSYMALWEGQKDRLLGYTISMDATALRAAVNKLITVDSTRHGVAETDGYIDTLIAQARSEISGSATWFDNQIRQAVIELESFIPFYRKGHETRYDPDDLTSQGEASLGSLPEESRLRDAYYVTDGTPCVRMPIELYDWQNRHDLICGVPRMTGRAFYMAIEPNADTFILFPALLEDYYLMVSWDGTKLDFEDADGVPFDEACAKAVAEYVQSQMYLRVSALNPKLAAMHNAQWVLKRLQCYLDAREKVDLRYRNESPHPLAGSSLCMSCAAEDDEFIEEGSGSTTTPPAPRDRDFVTYVATRAALKAVNPGVNKVVIITSPEESGLSLIYTWAAGDTSTANDFDVIQLDAPYADDGRMIARF